MKKTEIESIAGQGRDRSGVGVGGDGGRRGVGLGLVGLRAVVWTVDPFGVDGQQGDIGRGPG